MNTPRTRPRLGAFSEQETDSEIFLSTPRRWNPPSGRFGMPEDTEFSQQRLISVANRLPVTVVKEEDGSWGFRKSSGGLVSALRACENLHMTQVGWPGADIPVEDQEQVGDDMSSQHCVPVFLTRDEIDLYYNGFSNGVLWPLLHYVSHSYSSGSCEKEWQIYELVNRKFAQVIADQIRMMSITSDPSDILVWVHDYHLMLVPRFLRQLLPDARIGWFLHTPFPSVELFRMLPYREEILRGILGANYVSFQVPDYTRHFLSSCSILLNLPITPTSVDAVSVGGYMVHVDAVPIGIDPHAFIENSLEVADRVDQLRAQFGNKKIILGVDRLDYMKGLEHKLQAFEKFLELHPEWRGECVLVQLAVPSRGEVKDYQRLKKHVHELVGELCGRYGDLMTQNPPVVYLDQSVQFPELVALYRAADVLLITSIRDGMNLVAFEFVASQEDTCGVLVLSEFTGAMHSLGGGALSINPWDLEGVSGVLTRALEMGEAEKRARHEFCFEYVTTHTAQRWAETFLGTLRDATPQPHSPEELDMTMLLDAWTRSLNDRVLIVLDLEHCLVPVGDKSGKMDPGLKSSIDTILTQCPHVVIVVTSAMKRETIYTVFEHLLECEDGRNLVLAAENGCAVMSWAEGSTRQWSTVVAKQEDAVARAHTVRLLEFVRSQMPEHSYIEETDFCVKLVVPRGGLEESELVKELLLNRGPLSHTELVVARDFVEIRAENSGLRDNFPRIISTPDCIDLFQRGSISMCVMIGAFPYRDQGVYQSVEDAIVKLNSTSSPRQSQFADDFAIPLDPVTPRNVLLARNETVTSYEPFEFYSIGLGHSSTNAKYILDSPSQVSHLLREMASLVSARSRGA